MNRTTGDARGMIADASGRTIMTYIFYDTETTGKVTAFDQILQFAAIKTDAELNVLDTFDVRCRLLPYIVPSPGALLVTGTTVADITTCPLSHFEMMRLVHAKMHRWSEGGAIFVGWNSMKFDETLLRQAYYQIAAADLSNQHQWQWQG